MSTVQSSLLSALNHSADPQAPFEIMLLDGRHLLLIRLRHRWDEAIFEQFARDYGAIAHAMAGRDSFDHALVDSREFPIQRMEIASRFPELVKATNPVIAKRTAIVFSAIVAKAQAREVGELLNARFFRTMPDAIDWLFGSEA